MSLTELNWMNLGMFHIEMYFDAYQNNLYLAHNVVYNHHKNIIYTRIVVSTGIHEVAKQYSRQKTMSNERISYMIFNWASSLVGIRGRGWTGRAQKAWRNDVERKNAKRGIGLNKLRTYKLFKTEYKVEEYEFKGKAVNQRSAMSRFICGVAPINLEIGCFLIIPVNERLCNFCPDQVED